MQIAGFQKVSLIDYPGKIAAVIFTPGCNFRCPYCHNPELVISQSRELISEEEATSFLLERADKLQGVVITGGEPTLQQGLIPFIERIKDYGYSVKLDTNGSKPSVLRECVFKGIVDFIAMDIKAPLEKYDEASGVSVNTADICESIDIIINSKINHVFRTTVVKSFLTEDGLGKVTSLIKDADQYVLQEFNYKNDILDTSYLDKPSYTEKEFEDLQSRFEWKKEESRQGSS